MPRKPLRRAPKKWATNWAGTNGHDKYAIFSNEISHAVPSPHSSPQVGEEANESLRELNFYHAERSPTVPARHPAATVCGDIIAAFLLQWLRAPLRNPIGEFIMALTDFLVLRTAPFHSCRARVGQRVAAACATG